MNKYIMALDQGTTSSRCIIYDHSGNIISMAQKEFEQIYPKPGWVEHNPVEIWNTQLMVAQKAMESAKLTYENIAAIGITNQRETTVVWDRKTGEPVYNAIVWQCRRTAEYCDGLIDKGYKEMIRNKTGLLIDAYFSGSKLHWILENIKGARERADKGELCFGTIETWLIWNLTGGRVHVTDYSNAARTMMFNIHTLQWDKEILNILDIPSNILPEPHSNSEIYGETDEKLFGGPIPISGAAGDQQAALFGQCCFEKGSAKNTYGTGGFLLMNTGETVVESRNNLLSTIAWSIKGKTSYALEGSVFVEGAAIQWLRDELKLIEKASETEEIAKSVPNTGGVYMVPAFVGLGAPHWDPYARGTIQGLTRGTNKAHIVRATLESMAYQIYDLIDAMEQDAKLKLSQLKVDGGACANDFLMQFQADIINSTVVRPVIIETTSLGAAYLAGLAIGYWNDAEEVKENWQKDKVFTPAMTSDKISELLNGWHKAVKRSLSWEE